MDNLNGLAENEIHTYNLKGAINPLPALTRPFRQPSHQPLVPPDKYWVKYIKKAAPKKFQFGEERYSLWFQIIEGPYTGRILKIYYSTKKSILSKFYSHWCFVSKKLPTRTDRLPINVFKGKILQVQVNHKGLISQIVATIECSKTPQTTT